MTAALSRIEKKLKKANDGLNGASALYMSTFPMLAAMPRLAHYFSYLSKWTSRFFHTVASSFFLAALVIDLVKLVGQTLQTIFSDNVNFGKSGDILFNAAKVAVICAFLFGGALITPLIAFILLSTIVLADPLLNFCKTVYFGCRMLSAIIRNDIDKRNFFYDQLIESVKHSIISGIFGAALIILLSLPVTIPYAAVITVGVVGGLVLGGLGGYVLYPYLVKAYNKIRNWIWPKEVNNDKPQLVARELDNNKNEKAPEELKVAENEGPKIGQPNIILRMMNFDYYEHAVPDQYNLMPKIRKDNNSLDTHIFKLNSKSNDASFWEKNKINDKMNALIALDDVLKQWNKVITKNNENEVINKINKRIDFNTITCSPGKKYSIELNIDLENQSDPMKDVDRILKLIKRQILEAYPRAFQSIQYKGKVESIFEQAFRDMRHAAEKHHVVNNKEIHSDHDEGNFFSQTHNKSNNNSNNNLQPLLPDDDVSSFIFIPNKNSI